MDIRGNNRRPLVICLVVFVFSLAIIFFSSEGKQSDKHERGKSGSGVDSVSFDGANLKMWEAK